MSKFEIEGKSELNRRDFLKLTSIGFIYLAATPLPQEIFSQAIESKKPTKKILDPVRTLSEREIYYYQRSGNLWTKERISNEVLSSAEELPESVSYEDNAPYKATYQNANDCTWVAAAETYRTMMNIISEEDFWREGTANTYYDYVLDGAVNPAFTPAITGEPFPNNLPTVLESYISAGTCFNGIPLNYWELCYETEDYPNQVTLEQIENSKNLEKPIGWHGISYAKNSDYTVEDIKKLLSKQPGMMTYPLFDKAGSYYLTENGYFEMKIPTPDDTRIRGHAMILLGYEGNTVIGRGVEGSTIPIHIPEEWWDAVVATNNFTKICFMDFKELGPDPTPIPNPTPTPNPNQENNLYLTNIYNSSKP